MGNFDRFSSSETTNYTNSIVLLNLFCMDKKDAQLSVINRVLQHIGMQCSQRMNPSLRMFFLSILFLFISCLSAYSQSAKFMMNSLSPDWNGKTVCDEGAGYDPESITAPSLNYIGADPKMPSYNYSWEQRVNGGAWVTVASGTAKMMVPSYNPPALVNLDEKEAVYQWRLKVVDLANENQKAESDVYVLKLVSGLRGSYKIIEGANHLSDIELTLKGGKGKRFITWSCADPKKDFPKNQATQQNPKGLADGDYLLKVVDEGCHPYTDKIKINHKH